MTRWEPYVGDRIIFIAKSGHASALVFTRHCSHRPFAESLKAHVAVWEHRGICTPHRASWFLLLIFSFHKFCYVSCLRRFVHVEMPCLSGLWITRRCPSVLGGKHMAWIKFRTLCRVPVCQPPKFATLCEDSRVSPCGKACRCQMRQSFGERGYWVWVRPGATP